MKPVHERRWQRLHNEKLDDRAWSRGNRDIYVFLLHDQTLVVPVDIPMDVQDLTHVNATLNAISVVFLILAYRFIRAGDKEKHKICMLVAVGVSALFLVGYVTYKANSGFAKFGGEGMIRPIYFTILAVHVIGAMLITPLVPYTLYRALTGNFEKHRKIARWTWPLWTFVGISGVVVYFMAVHLYPHVPI
jgi:putative membrane protein